MTRWIVPPLRRLVQLASIAVLVLLPVFALYTHYKEARAIADLPDRAWRTAVLRGVDWMVGEDETRRQLVATTQGTIWSARIGGISLSDPLAAAETIVSSRSIYLPLLASIVVPLALSLVLGRVFCGWICPMNTLLEVVDRCRRLLALLELRPRDVKFSLRNKYVVLALTLGLVALTGTPFLALVYPPAVLSREMHGLVFGTGLGIGVYLILAICAFELFVSKRWWCRYVCPGGAVYCLLGRFRAVRVRRDESRCTHCGDCVRVCQFDLRPMLVTTTGMECTNCAACISGCEYGALSYQLVLPTIPSRRAVDDRPDSPAGSDSPAPEHPASGSAVLPDASGAAPRQAAGQAASPLPRRILLLALALLLTPQAAFAHHILGLPHYSYKENYPQVPTLEYPATTGPYDVLMTSYPGHPVPGEAGTIAFYIKDRNSGQPYAKPVTVRVLKTATFGSSDVVHEPATHFPFDNQHKYTVTFPSDGEYIIELTMEVEGQAEVIPFLMVVGNPTATRSIVLALVAGLAAFLIVVRAIKVKRDRRHKSASREMRAATPSS